ncbi:MAG: glycosyltransferase, partial [Lachnospiraceae bacterium]|nr:glycosyltransferase [Lachnospiraceae bacterium]
MKTHKENQEIEENRERLPLISVIVPVYGTEELFDRCMDSLLSQSLKELEIVVVDDGSGGDIRERIKPRLADPRVRFFSNDHNQGLIRARVRGLREARGKYVAFADSDDYVSFDFYRAMFFRAEETGADIVVGDTVWEENGEQYVYPLHEHAFSFEVLKGNAVREAFFGQELQNYSWHTVWNKLYSRELIEKCMPEFQSVERHVVMTEDVYFSSILFFFAESVASADAEAYFYCQREEASTGTSGLGPAEFYKKISDISFVFRRTEAFLRKKGASKDLLKYLAGGKRHYASLWTALAGRIFAGKERDAALKRTEMMLGKGENCGNPWFYESIRTKWNGGLDFLKRETAFCREACVSFDIFDTLILRDVFKPEDLFLFLDPLFSELTGMHIRFSVLRKEAESLAREAYNREHHTDGDITLAEIYETLSREYEVEPSVCQQMMEEECRQELLLCRTRNAGKALLETALSGGKRVILVSDMYLTGNTVKMMLDRCGISGFDAVYLSSEVRRRKADGGLFREVLKREHLSASDLLHIGDSWEGDICGAGRCGIRTLFFPSVSELAENRIEGCRVNRLSSFGQKACGCGIRYADVTEMPEFRRMRALSMNRFLDHPYRTFHPDSDFDADPFAIGFTLLGPHILGMLHRIEAVCRHEDISRLVFLARDGWLLKCAWQVYIDAGGGSAGLPDGAPLYVRASRRVLLPWMIRSDADLYALPVVFSAHTPDSLRELLSFCGREIPDREWRQVLNEYGLSPDLPLNTVQRRNAFLKLYRKKLYDPRRHSEARELVRAYLRQIPEKSLLIDLGYSGRIELAISDAIGRRIRTFFLHENQKEASFFKLSGKIGITSFYPLPPQVTGLFREYLFAEPAPACIGLRKENGAIVPVFEELRRSAADRWVTGQIRAGALRYVREYTEKFGHSRDDSSADAACSLPLEEFLS